MAHKPPVVLFSPLHLPSPLPWIRDIVTISTFAALSLTICTMWKRLVVSERLRSRSMPAGVSTNERERAQEKKKKRRKHTHKKRFVASSPHFPPPQQHPTFFINNRATTLSLRLAWRPTCPIPTPQSSSLRPLRLSVWPVLASHFCKQNLIDKKRAWPSGGMCSIRFDSIRFTPNLVLTPEEPGNNGTGSLQYLYHGGRSQPPREGEPKWGK